MIERVYDPAIINAFSQHPEIVDEIGGPLDFTEAMRETAEYYFGEHGGLIFEWCAPGTYEVHVMLTRAGRGRAGVEIVKQALELLGADHVWARVQKPHVALFARWSGFREVEQRTLYVAGEPSVWRIFEWRKPCRL